MAPAEKRNAFSYTTSLKGIEPRMLVGFFDGWTHPPSPATHMRILAGSSHVIMAIDEDEGRVVGFINAVSDGFFAASIPLLEVLPAYRGRGIGSTLVRHMLERLEDFYSIDLTCDPTVQAFYEKLGLQPATGMMRRHRKRQATGATRASDDL